MRIKMLVWLSGLLFLLVYACKDDSQQDNGCPSAPVNITIYLNNPSSNALNVYPSYMYISGGVKGIIIYRRAEFEYIAIERNCTYNCDNACATVKMEKSGTTLIDTCCGSTFQAYNGAVTKGPATRTLRTYATKYIDGNKTLEITN